MLAKEIPRLITTVCDISNRKSFVSGDWFNGTNAEYKEEATSYIAYTSPFHVDEEKQTLTHSMFISLFTNWTGQTHPRIVKIEGNVLHLSPATPITSGRKQVMYYLA